MGAAAPYPALRPEAAPALPVSEMILGTPATEAAALLPRLFGLCRAAQGVAARAAFGLAPEPGWRAGLRHEIMREHVAKLCLKWPALLSRPAVRLPRDWAADGAGMRAALFGPAGRLPDTRDGFRAFLRAGNGIAPVLCAIDGLFADGEACRTGLPVTTPDRVFDAGPQENSVAARHAAHPVMRGIAATRGRGPLWSAAAVALDLQAALDDRLPAPRRGPGRAVVPAARGLYGVTARVGHGRVTAFSRVTPTDHLVAPGGALAQSLATLPAHRAGAIAPLLLAILDPCQPVTLHPAPQEARAHA